MKMTKITNNYGKDLYDNMTQRTWLIICSWHEIDLGDRKYWETVKKWSVATFSSFCTIYLYKVYLYTGPPKKFLGRCSVEFHKIH